MPLSINRRGLIKGLGAAGLLLPPGFARGQAIGNAGGWCPQFKIPCPPAGGLPAWVPNGAIAYYEFTTNRGFARGAVQPSSTSDWTITRAGASAYDLAGTTLFTANTFRRTAAGLLIEPSGTNNLFQAFAYSTTPWVDRNAPTITPGQTAPDGTTNASAVTIGLGGAGGVNLYQICNAAGGSAPSFFIKKITASGTLYFENPQSNASGEWHIDFSLLGSGWERITPTHPAVTVMSAFVANAAQAGHYFLVPSGTISWNMWGNQYEDGSAPSSFIPTTTAAVTRAADAMSRTLEGGITTALYTFDDSSTQSIAASGAYTVPTNLNRPLIVSVKFT